MIYIFGLLLLSGAGAIVGVYQRCRAQPAPATERADSDTPRQPAPLPLDHWRCTDCGRQAVPEWYDGRCYRCYTRYAELVMKQAAVLVASRERIQDIDAQLALLLSGVPEVWQPFDDGARG